MADFSPKILNWETQVCALHPPKQNVNPALQRDIWQSNGLYFEDFSPLSLPPSLLEKLVQNIMLHGLVRVNLELNCSVCFGAYLFLDPIGSGHLPFSPLIYTCPLGSLCSSPAPSSWHSSDSSWHCSLCTFAQPARHPWDTCPPSSLHLMPSSSSGLWSNVSHTVRPILTVLFKNAVSLPQRLTGLLRNFWAHVGDNMMGWKKHGLWNEIKLEFEIWNLQLASYFSGSSVLRCKMRPLHRIIARQDIVGEAPSQGLAYGSSQ